MNRIVLTAYSLIVVVIVFYIFIIGKDLIIPFIIAIVFWYLIDSLRKLFGRIKIGRLKLPVWGQTIAASIAVLVVITLIGELIFQNMNAMMKSVPEYRIKFEGITKQVIDAIGIKEIPDASNLLEDLNFGTLIGSVVNSLSSIAGSAFLIIIYVGFILAEQQVFNKKLTALFPDKEDFDRVQSILTSINESIQTYISVKTFVSFLTGILSFIVFAAVGLDFAIFWAALIFFLNYIPTVGSLIATAFPALLALVQFDTLGPFIIVLIGVGAIQIVIGSILDPKMMGNSLNLSTLVVILSLSLWGAIWGIAGMVLSMPIMVIIMIILSQFESTRPIAILLSQNGNIQSNDPASDRKE